MQRFDHYKNQEVHGGILPVRVLGQNIIDWLQKISPRFLEEMEYEIADGLKRAISYNVDDLPIDLDKLPRITPEKQICLYENFNQLLWSMSYSILVLFEIGILKPTHEHKFTGTFDGSNPVIRRAEELFKAGMSLMKAFNRDVFYALPNPEKYDESEQYYIEKANGLYVGAQVFTLLHEIGHKYHNHLEYQSTPSESKTNELTADEYAISRMADGFNTGKGEAYKTGAIIGLCALIFLDNTMSGGKDHPDPDLRISKLLDYMDLDSNSYLWFIAALAFLLWANEYNIKFQFLNEYSDAKQLFDHIISLLKAYKEKVFWAVD